MLLKTNVSYELIVELEAESAFGLPKNLDDSDDSGVDSD